MLSYSQRLVKVLSYGGEVYFVSGSGVQGVNYGRVGVAHESKMDISNPAMSRTLRRIWFKMGPRWISTIQTNPRQEPVKESGSTQTTKRALCAAKKTPNN